MREPRLGDDIDDFCVRCKRIMNHAIVSVVNGEPAKVRCRTCHNDHDYRHELAPPPKVDLRKQALFNEALKKINPAAAAEAAAVADVEIEADDLAPEEVAPELDPEAEGDAAPVEEPAPKPPKPKSKPKPAKAAAKAKPKGRKGAK
jgi:hypothetical protein